MSKCPSCNVLAAVHSSPHCKNKQCTWNKRSCGEVYDRQLPPEASP